MKQGGNMDVLYTPEFRRVQDLSFLTRLFPHTLAHQSASFSSQWLNHDWKDLVKSKGRCSALE